MEAYNFFSLSNTCWFDIKMQMKLLLVKELIKETKDELPNKVEA